MRHVDLQGWNVAVRRCQILVQGSNGHPEEADGWELVFEEVIPKSGNTVHFKMSREVRDFVVRELTGGIVLSGGELPNL